MKPLEITLKKFHCLGNLKNKVWCNFYYVKHPRFMRCLKWECSQNICGLDSVLSVGNDDK